jgi:phenylacetate-CoA ligase
VQALTSNIARLEMLALERWPAGHPRLLAHLEKTSRLAPSELLRDQLLRVQKLALHAYERVPFYRSRLAGLCEIPLGALTLDGFRERVPILTRAELRDAGEAIVACAVGPAHRPNGMRTTTSGSTGRPITTDGSHLASVLAAAQQDRFHRWHARDASLATAFITRPEPFEKAGIWTVLGRGPALHFPLSRPTHDQLDWLVRTKPAYLVSYPSNVRALARASLELGVVLPSLRDVTVSSEPVSDDLRDLVERAWGTKLVATYSANEVGGIALEGTGAGYRVQAEFVLVEIVAPDGTPSAPGEVGRVIVTELHGAYRPLIRYEIGDYAEPGPEPTDEMSLPIIARVLGRERNMLRLPEGGEVWPYFEMGELEELRALRQWQLVQRSLREVEVRIVVGRPLDAHEAGVVRGVVERSLPGRFVVTLRVVEAIPRGAGGKYEEFVNALDGSWKDPLP